MTIPATTTTATVSTTYIAGAPRAITTTTVTTSPSTATTSISALHSRAVFQLSAKLVDRGLLPALTYQISVNFYSDPSDATCDSAGMAMHQDGDGSRSCVLTFLSGATLDFRHLAQDDSCSVYLEPVSALFLSGASFSSFADGIEPRAADQLHPGLANFSLLSPQSTRTSTLSAKRGFRVSVVLFANE